MQIYSKNDVAFAEITNPDFGLPDKEYPVGEDVYRARLSRFAGILAERGLDCAVIYADREHYSNFRYFMSYEPRFEEGLLVIHKDGRCFVVLGNECFDLYKLSPVPVTPVLCQALSLPGQPAEAYTTMQNCFHACGISQGSKVGVVDWKLLPDSTADFAHASAVPSFIIDALRDITGRECVINITDALISPACGIRTVNDACDISNFERGAAQAGQSVMNAVNRLEEGVSEFEIADGFITGGQVLSCHPIVAFGDNALKGLISPTRNKLKTKDAVSMSLGLAGGLTCRGGYAATLADADEKTLCFIENVAKPYFAAVASWYANVGIGMTGGELFDIVNGVIPKSEFGWVLNPGHLIATEEWLSSPISPNDKTLLRSGMIVQMDIIPSVEGFVSPNMEDGVCIADEGLRAELERDYPEVYSRMMKRREFMQKHIGIPLKPEILPMSNCAALWRPLMLDKKQALRLAL